MLSGGLAMIPNFARRLREEIIFFLNDTEKYPEFKQLKNLQNLISFTNFEYPSNTLNFVGGLKQLIFFKSYKASMQGSISGIDKFMVTNTDYMNNN